MEKKRCRGIAMEGLSRPDKAVLTVSGKGNVCGERRLPEAVPHRCIGGGNDPYPSKATWMRRRSLLSDIHG